MAKKSYKILKTIIALILLTITMLGLVSFKNNSNAVNYNKTLAYSETQLLGNSILYNANYGKSYVPYRALALQSSQTYAALSNSYKNATENGIYYIETLLNDPNLYCMNHGFTFASNTYYCCYETGSISAKLAYIIARQEDGSRDQNNDLEANAVWQYFSSTEKSKGQIPLYNDSDFKNLWNRGNKAVEVMQNYINGKSNIYIEAPTDNPIYVNSEGKYGPFKITYPNVEGVLVGESIEILVNGTKIKNAPASGEEFYLTINDGIKLGEKNTLKVIYKGYTYSGTYAKFTPYRKIVVERYHALCDTYFGFNAWGYYKTNKDGKIEFREPDGAMGEEYLYTRPANGTATSVSDHSEWYETNYGCPICNKTNLVIGYTTAEENYYDDWQNLIYIEPNEEIFEEEEEIEFTPGKLITLEGKVWLDGQTGIKPVSSPNNQYNEGEELLENIEVILKKEGDDTPVKTTKTDANGKYIFEDVIVDGKTEYYIEFRYDGINYEAVVANTGSDDTIDSDAEEVGRDDFNKKFQTITKNTATGGDKSIDLSYERNGTDAKLKTRDSEGVLTDFAMTAKTAAKAYKEDTKNIDLGLVERGVDLSATTQIESARVFINNNSKVYEYNVASGDDTNKTIKLEDETATYNLYLYKSDYNYRIINYAGLKTLSENESGSSLLKNSIVEILTEYENKQDELDELLRNKEELNILLKYQILINNESATTATVNNIAYYYETGLFNDGVILIYREDEFGNKSGINNCTVEKEKFTDGSNRKYNRINIPVNSELTDSDNQDVIYIEFLINKDDNGNIKKDDVENWVEITSYSADKGCIDIDSAPDNIEEYREEDDSDNAGVLHIENQTSERTISGYVFEDFKTEANPAGDGKYTDNEKKVNDVIVQLIEVKDVTIAGTTKRLEYIWQETRSGSGQVKYITTSGAEIGEYTLTPEELAEADISNGGYLFKGFIPGNYIIRFIYGDGTYYDVSTDAGKVNILTYNGQDYKSAIDKYYQDKEYDENKYDSNASMARDNEMRRIEEMAYVATLTDSEKLKIDKKEELTDTWMCAETSDIKIPITQDNTGVISENKVSKNINFGLVKRPEVSIELEKHITALKIWSTGETLVDASIDINNASSDSDYEIDGNYINGTIGELKSLVTITNKGDENTTNGNVIGNWIVETSAEKVQGMNMNITYTYTVKSTGEENYIGNALAGIELTNEDSINTIKDSINSNSYVRGTYIGKAYYTGVKGEGDIQDSITNIKIEDYLGDLNLNSGDFKQTASNDKDVLIEINPDKKTKKENVKIIQSNDEFAIPIGGNSSITKNLTVEHSVDTSGGNTTYRSYVAQLIGNNCVTKAGITLSDIALDNLEYVQSYAPVTYTTDVAPESDEFIAETVLITVDTGGTVADSNKEEKLNLVIAVVAGLAVVATGIVLIKKFVIK